MREIKSKDWGDFCERVNRDERGGIITIQKLEPDGARREVTRNAAFGRLDFGRRDDCSDHLAIHSSGPNAVAHDIIEPIHIRLDEVEGGAAFHSVVIEAEDGVTQIDFRPVIRAESLEGLELR